jgi:hypothetical protein
MLCNTAQLATKEYSVPMLFSLRQQGTSRFLLLCSIAQRAIEQSNKEKKSTAAQSVLEKEITLWRESRCSAQA